MEITHIKCPSCGGQVDCSKDFETATCQFCKAVLALEWSGNGNIPRVDNKCPSCGKIVQPDFIACPYCAETVLVDCPDCGRHIRKSWTTCPYCKAPLVPEIRQKIQEEKMNAEEEIDEYNFIQRLYEIIAIIVLVVSLITSCSLFLDGKDNAAVLLLIISLVALLVAIFYEASIKSYGE